MNEEQLKEWHDAVVETMAKYDCNTIEEVYEKARAYERTKVLEEVLDAFKNEWTLDSLASHYHKYDILAIIKRQIEQLKELKND